MYTYYQNKKDTGINWLPQIPEHWEMEKINALFSERKQIVSDRDFPPLSVTKFGVVPQLADAVKTKDGDKRKLVVSGDFVINSRSDRRGSSGLSKYTGSVSLINIVLQPRDTLCGAYYHYLFRSHMFIEEFYRNGRGIVADLWTTRYSEMKIIYVPVPPKQEQEQIARFLHWKISTINKLIPYRALTTGNVIAQSDSLFSREMMLLNEYRIRLISDVVTGNIDVRGIEVPVHEFDIINEMVDEDTGDEEELNDTSEVEVNENVSD
jgi:restriction endonuclease S subunit